MAPENCFIQLPGDVRGSHDENPVLGRGSGAVYLCHELCLQASRCLMLILLGGDVEKDRRERDRRERERQERERVRDSVDKINMIKWTRRIADTANEG